MPLPELKDSHFVEASAKLGYALHEAEQTPKKADGVKDARPFVILNGVITYVDDSLQHPPRKFGTIQYGDAESFVLAIKAARTDNAGKLDTGKIYGSIDPAQFTAVFNDHGATAGFRDHRAEFKLKHSKEWDLWMGHNGVSKAFGGNEEFGFFVENHASDFADPAGAVMLEIALNFRASNNVSFRNVVRLADGKVDLAYSEIVAGESATTQGGALQKVSIPEKFSIKIPVFAGIDQPLYDLEARFRFRVAGGGLKIWYDIVEPHKATEAAFKAIWAKINTDTDQDILFGVA